MRSLVSLLQLLLSNALQTAARRDTEREARRPRVHLVGCAAVRFLKRGPFPKCQNVEKQFVLLMFQGRNVEKTYVLRLLGQNVENMCFFLCFRVKMLKKHWFLKVFGSEC